MTKVKEAVTLDYTNVEKLEKIAFILKTVAHPVRLGVIKLLELNEQMSVSGICEALGTEQSLTSHHLQNMKLKGLLKVKQEGRSRFYSLKERDIIKLIDCLEHCECNM